MINAKGGILVLYLNGSKKVMAFMHPCITRRGISHRPTVTDQHEAKRTESRRKLQRDHASERHVVESRNGGGGLSHLPRKPKPNDSVVKPEEDSGGTPNPM